MKLCNWFCALVAVASCMVHSLSCLAEEPKIELVWKTGDPIVLDKDSHVAGVLAAIHRVEPEVLRTKIIDIHDGKEDRLTVFVIYRVNVAGEIYLIAQTLPGSWKSQTLSEASLAFIDKIYKKLEEKVEKVESIQPLDPVCLALVFKEEGRGLIYEADEKKWLLSAFFSMVDMDVERIQRFLAERSSRNEEKISK
jgi:hypothetical protein